MPRVEINLSTATLTIFFIKNPMYRDDFFYFIVLYRVNKIKFKFNKILKDVCLIVF